MPKQQKCILHSSGGQKWVPGQLALLRALFMQAPPSGPPLNLITPQRPYFRYHHIRVRASMCEFGGFAFSPESRESRPALRTCQEPYPSQAAYPSLAQTPGMLDLSFVPAPCKKEHDPSFALDQKKYSYPQLCLVTPPLPSLSTRTHSHGTLQAMRGMVCVFFAAWFHQEVFALDRS